MYVGSAEFLAANASKFQKHRITGTIDNIPFSAGNILAGSLTITRQSSDTSDAKIGAVFISKLTCTFLNNIGITARSWQGRKVTINFGLCIDEDPESDPPETYEYFKLGEFYIAEANVVPEGVAVTAYDAMSRFDEALPYEYLTSGSVYNVLAGICATCGVAFGMSQSEVEALPNGAQTIGLYTPNDCQTYRDILYWISVTCGGWATINRDGKLIIETYPTASVLGYEINDTMRLGDVSFSDFVTNFAAATFENDDGTIQVIGSPAAGVTYDVGFDPFLQFGTPETKNAMRTAVFESIFGIRYMPFKIELMSAPVFDLGDVVYLNGGVLEGNGYNGIVQRIVFTAGKGFTIEGFGANPNLQPVGGKSETGRAVQQAVINSEVVHKRFENDSLYIVEDEADPVQVVNIDFSTTKETDIEVWHEIQLISQNATGQNEIIVMASYYFDGVLMDRRPVEVYDHDGMHLLDLHYCRPVSEVGAHNWAVYLEAHGGELTIQQNGILALLKGQGIAKGDTWTGVIILDDEIDRAGFGFSARTVSDSVTLTLCDVDRIQVADTIARAAFGFGARTFAESLAVILEQPTFDIVDESGEYDITDESGAYDLETE